ncbi:hypothetical protein Zm00014a_030464 [Zea mays]|uniref:Uncharacterized protein n=1 Tax=Zea mays TaxID=4577 RepID=A0A3L6DL33_MAIZE|nr:hypothetical protein Zm00014a_030464 [Zea mays]
MYFQDIYSTIHRYILI